MAKRCPRSTKVQSLIFDRATWTVKKAKAWANRQRNFSGKKVDVTKNQIRIRQMSPNQCLKSSFRIKNFSKKKGIKAVICCPKIS